MWDLKILNSATGQFNTVRLNDKYYLATNDFLAAGGDGYTMLGGLREEDADKAIKILNKKRLFSFFKKY